MTQNKKRVLYKELFRIGSLSLKHENKELLRMFRYVTITGLPVKPTREDITAQN